MSFTPVSWQYDESVRVDQRHPITIDLVRGIETVRYAVRQSGECMSKTGEWEYEPSPSSRDDEFLARCRFETLEAAVQAIERFCVNGKRRVDGG